MRRWGKILLTTLLSLCLLCGCEKPSDLRDQVITVDGLSITLPGTYVDQQELGLFSEYDFAYGYTDVLVAGFKEDFSLFGSVPTLIDYAAALNSDLNGRFVERGDPYILEFDQDTARYYAGIYQTEDSFWVIYVGCPADAFSSMEAEFQGYLYSVRFES